MVVAKRGRLTPAPFLLFLALAGSSCDETPPPVSGNPSSQQQIQWERIKSWSGSGSQYLDSFTSDTGALRIEWETKRVEGAAEGGSLKVVIHSAISGRPLTAPVIDHTVRKGRRMSAKNQGCSSQTSSLRGSSGRSRFPSACVRVVFVCA